MYERFTDDARRAMQAANQEAMRHGHDYIGVEHILLGILAQPGIVAEACESLGVPASRVASAVRSELQKEPASRSPLQAKRVIEYAIEASRAWWLDSIGTDHVMLVILNAAPPDLIIAIESAGLRCADLKNELARRNPRGTSPPPSPLETLVPQFLDHPEVAALYQNVVSLHQKKEEAVAGQDFELGVRLRDEQERVKRALIAVITRLQGESQSPSQDRHDD